MKRTTLLALALLAAGCASPSASPVASPTASGLPASRAASPSGARKGYDLCAAPSIPGQPSATTGPDALASVTYRNGLGKAFLYVWWWTYASGRGPANAILVAHNP
jgi:hypothetical protein